MFLETSQFKKYFQPFLPTRYEQFLLMCKGLKVEK